MIKETRDFDLPTPQRWAQRSQDPDPAAIHPDAPAGGGEPGKKAIDKLTPASENDTTQYLADLKRAGVDIDKDVPSQIDSLMTAIEANEGLIAGIGVDRLP